jgi:hypothetical protein
LEEYVTLPLPLPLPAAVAALALPLSPNSAATAGEFIGGVKNLLQLISFHGFHGFHYIYFFKIKNNGELIYYLKK